MRAWRAANPAKLREYQKRWAQKFPERAKRISREAHFKHEYGLTLAQVEELKAAQAGLCGICAQPAATLVVDHDHSTDAVRGMLCEPCNQGLGFFADSLERLDAAWHYIAAQKGAQ